MDKICLVKQRDFRKLHGLTQAEFGRRVGIHVQTVWRYENIGRVPEPPVMRRIMEISDGTIDAESYYVDDLCVPVEIQACENIQ